MHRKTDGLMGNCPNCKKPWDWQHELLEDCPIKFNRVQRIKGYVTWCLQFFGVVVVLGFIVYINL